jgi:hypothetical protein
MKLHKRVEILTDELHEIVNNTTFIERLLRWKNIKLETNKLINKLKDE